MNAGQPKRRPLARILALTLALGAPAVGFAQTGKEAELETRIQMLEAQLAELKAMVAEQKAATAPAPAPAAGSPPPIQATTITPGRSPEPNSRWAVSCAPR